jgi:hypothetical protein
MSQVGRIIAGDCYVRKQAKLPFEWVNPVGFAAGGAIGAGTGGLAAWLASREDEGLTPAERKAELAKMIFGVVGGGIVGSTAGNSLGNYLSRRPVTKLAGLAGDCYVKRAESPARRQRRQEADKLVNMDSIGGRLADLSPLGWGGERAGRAETLGRATDPRGYDGDMDTTMVQHPLTTNLLSNAFGAVGGGVLGAGIGGGLAALHSGGGDGVGEGAAVGGIAGALGGSLLGHIAAVIERRQEMRDIKERYVNEGGSASVPEFSTAATVLAPLRGSHRKGQMEAYRFMQGDQGGTRRSPLMTDASYIAPMLTGPATGPLAMVRDYYNNIRSHVDASGEAKKRKAAGL